MSRPLVVALVALGLAAYYATSCVFWPYRTCWRCRGNPRRRAWWGGGHSLCSWCDGTGQRRKFGRWLYAYIRNKRKDAS
jgi:hypothetical protein